MTREPSRIGIALKHIPYIDITGEYAGIRADLLDAVSRVIDSGQFVLGQEVAEFEGQFAELCGVRFAIAVNSGTDALTLALRALGIGAGDEVITVPNSFVASASCIALVGATPVFVDVRDDYNMDPGQIERAVTRRTRAILPVHLTGRPADMEPILETARTRGLCVVEDCAQAILAEYRGRRVGSFGAFGCFSLHPLKTLGVCGDGGVITTQNEETYDRLRVLRNHGLRTRDNCVTWSINSRLDTIHASMLLVKLKYLHQWTAARRANAAFYQEALAKIPGLRVPIDKPHERTVYHTFIVEAERRDALKQYLAEHGVQTAIHYPVPIHLQEAAASLGHGRGSFPVAERQAERILSLPVHPQLAHDDLAYVARMIRTFYGA